MYLNKILDNKIVWIAYINLPILTPFIQSSRARRHDVKIRFCTSKILFSFYHIAVRHTEMLHDEKV